LASHGKRPAQEAASKAASINDKKSEAEIMLRELQHRVKNNLQVIVSFLALQGREATNERASGLAGSWIASRRSASPTIRFFQEKRQ
jgi:two-component sensor histidine kinase